MPAARRLEWVGGVCRERTSYSKASHHVLVYCGTYHQCCPKFRAGVPCTIPSVLGYHVPSQNSGMGYFVPSQGMYWYVLRKIRDSGPEFRPLGHCRFLAVSSRGPKFEP